MFRNVFWKQNNDSRRSGKRFLYTVISLMCIIAVMVTSFPFVGITTAKAEESGEGVLPVIPGAAGFGIDTPAGRGGKILRVTSLADSNDKGTLRWAIAQKGPRTIIFDVSGTIEANNAIQITNPYITIAGQTAPSPGIFIKGGVFFIKTHDVLIQHLRTAPGDHTDGGVTPYDNRDGASIGSETLPVNNVVIDHCTFTWSIDEMFGTYYPHGNVTFRNVIGSEPMHRSIHPKGGYHSFGPLFSNDPGGKVTFTGSLLSHVTCRAPLAESTEFVMVNNMIYDRGFYGTQLRNQFGNPTKMTLEGNYYVDGPSILDTSETWYTWAPGRAPILVENDPSRFDFQSDSQVYLHDNAWTDHLGVTRDITWPMVGNNFDSKVNKEDIAVYSRPTWNDGLVALPSSEVEEYVLENAGARPAERLPYEERIVTNARNRTGGLVNSIAEVGGWPVLENNTRQLIVPKDPNNDDDEDGYTNLEEWLHSYAAFVEGKGPEPALIAPEDGEPIEVDEDIPDQNNEPVIIDLVVNDAVNASNWVIKNNLIEEDFVYTDRTFTFASVPESVYGSEWISPANNSKLINSDPLVTFKVDRTSDVYVAIDSRILEDQMPEWISEWIDTGEDVLVDSGSILTYRLYKKNYVNGSNVLLGGNGTSTIHCQYIVMVKPLPMVADMVVYDTNETNKANWVIKNNLQEGDFLYGDRTFTYETVPEIVAGRTWISPANNSKSLNINPLVTFKVNNDSVVYVALDTRLTEAHMPIWISEWINTGEDMVSDTGSNITYRLYRKSYNANSTVSLGGNGTSTNTVQYITIVDIKGESEPGNGAATITSPTGGSVLKTLPAAIAGTAVDTDSGNEGVIDVKAALLQNATNKYYDPSTKAFDSSTAIYGSVYDSYNRNSGAWTLDVEGVSFDNGQYTVRAYVDDGEGGDVAVSSFTVAVPRVIFQTIPTATAGQEFDVSVELSSVPESVYAHDITIDYDVDLYEYLAAEAVDSILIDSINDSETGDLRIFTVSEGATEAEAHIANISLRAKTTGEVTGISLIEAYLGFAPSGGTIEALEADAKSEEEEPADKSLLTAAIEAAEEVYEEAEEGSLPGEYPEGSKATLQAAIDAAQEVADSESATQSEVDAAIATLTAAVSTFEASVNVEVEEPDDEEPNDEEQGGSGTPSGNNSGNKEDEKVVINESDDGSVKVEIKPELKKDSNEAVSSISKEQAQQIFDKVKANNDGVKKAVLEIAKVEGAAQYTQQLPADLLSSEAKDTKIEIKTALGIMEVPGNMFKAEDLKGDAEVQLTIGAADKESLPEDVKKAIGDRPVIELNAKSGDSKISWNNPDAPVTVSIDYTPSVEELSDPEHIVVWYVDGDGKVIPVPNGKYNKATGKVTFTTTHFSKYAIAFVNKTFSDIVNFPWAQKQIEVMASRGIINGTGADTFTPAANITRADFITLLVKSLGLSAVVESNFSDVSKDMYYYDAVGIAKKLGIVTGVGNGSFNPKDQISRQDMMVIIARAARMAKKLDAADASTVLSSFTDSADITNYAVNDIAALVKAELVKGSGNKINPKGNTTRAEAAVLLYRAFVAE